MNYFMFPGSGLIWVPGGRPYLTASSEPKNHKHSRFASYLPVMVMGIDI